MSRPSSSCSARQDGVARRARARAPSCTSRAQTIMLWLRSSTVVTRASAGPTATDQANVGSFLRRGLAADDLGDHPRRDALNGKHPEIITLRLCRLAPPVRRAQQAAVLGEAAEEAKDVRRDLARGALSASVWSKPHIIASRLSRSDTASSTSAIRMRRPKCGLARSACAEHGAAGNPAARARRRPGRPPARPSRGVPAIHRRESPAIAAPQRAARRVPQRPMNRMPHCVCRHRVPPTSSRGNRRATSAGMGRPYNQLDRWTRRQPVMISPELASAFNEQIGHEFGASMQYVSIAAHFQRSNLTLLAKLFFAQAEEEREHAMKFVQVPARHERRTARCRRFPRRRRRSRPPRPPSQAALDLGAGSDAADHRR